MLSAQSEYQRFVEAQRPLPLGEIIKNLRAEHARHVALQGQRDQKETATYHALLSNILALLQTGRRPAWVIAHCPFEGQAA